VNCNYVRQPFLFAKMLFICLECSDNVCCIPTRADDAL
jgi:hypothetical protein